MAVHSPGLRWNGRSAAGRLQLVHEELPVVGECLFCAGATVLIASMSAAMMIAPLLTNCLFFLSRMGTLHRGVQSTIVFCFVITGSPVPLMTWLIPLPGCPPRRIVTMWRILTPGAAGVSIAFSARTGAL